MQWYKLKNTEQGDVRQGVGYKYFMPTLINKNWTWSDAKINKLIENTFFQF